MKKIFTWLCLALITINAYSQQAKEHTVLRGETPESVAEKYGITVDELKEENPKMKKFFYVGMTLTIPQKLLASNEKTEKKRTTDKPDYDDGDIDSVAIIQAQLEELLERIKKTDQYWEEGDQAFAKGNYKKAENKYTKALDLGGDDPDLYYNRALCSLKRDKYNHAIDDFKACLRNDPDDELREQANTMLDLARDLKSERADRRGQIIGGALLLAAGTALAVTEANLMQQYSQSGYNPYSSNMFMPYSSMPATNEYSVYSQRNAYLNQEIARSNMQTMQLQAKMMELNRQQQIELNRKQQMLNNVQSVAFEAYRKYKEDPFKYPDEYFTFRYAFNQKFDRNPTYEEDAAYHEYFLNMEYSSSGSSNDTDSDSKITSTYSTDYQAEYKQLENRVKEAFNDWTVIGGFSTTDKNGKTDVYINSNNAGGTNLTMFRNVRDYQRQMTQIREEARKNGVTIMQSEWETKDVSNYYYSK